MNKCTPDQTAMVETRRERTEIKAETIAMKYEEKLRYWSTDTLKGACPRLLRRNDVKSRLEARRKNFLEKRRWFNGGLTTKMYTDDLISRNNSRIDLGS